MVAKDPALEEGKLKALGGSRSDDFNHVLANQVVNTLWTKHSDDALRTSNSLPWRALSSGSAPRTSLRGCWPDN
jgi:hypothetical protein